MTSEDPIDQWECKYNQTNVQGSHRRVTQLHEKMKNHGETFLIWLGGPGKGHPMYCFRILVKKLLERHNFEVMFSEDYAAGPDVASKEIQEVTTSDLVVLMALSPGSASECIEFSYHLPVRPKMRVFFPDKYTKGYVYRSLYGRHCLIGEESVFSLDGVQKLDSELPVKILQRAVASRVEKLTGERLMDELGSNFKG